VPQLIKLSELGLLDFGSEKLIKILYEKPHKTPEKSLINTLTKFTKFGAKTP
jgi:hypothetical protein